MRFSILFFASLALAGCSSSSTDEDASPKPTPKTEPTRACDAVGSTRCEGSLVSTCAELPDGSTAWSPAAGCPSGQSCREDACVEPTARMKSQAKAVGDLVDALAPDTAWHQPVDAASVKARETKAILEGDGTDLTYVAAAWHALNAFPQGHQSLYSQDKAVCGKLVGYQATSRFGVCGRPSAQGLAITNARAGNKLGLARGDVVVKVDGDEGDALFEKAYARPQCGGVYPAASGRRYAAAASFFATVPVGAKLTVKTVAGATRELTIPDAGDAQISDCTDPFGRSRELHAEAITRPDGVVVIRVPSFVPFDKPFPTNPAEFDPYTAAFQAEIQKVFDTVKTAKAIVWDIRGNGGGLTKVGLAIVNGFPTAKATNLSYCRSRAPGSSPPSFLAERYAPYAIEPGGPFAYAGKVAVVVDGMNYSAADYFPFAAKKGAGVTIVGSATAGAFGGGHAPIEVAGPPKLDANYDAAACFDAATDKPLEGAPLPPTVAVEYDPAELAAGRDPVLERAVKELGF